MPESMLMRAWRRQTPIEPFPGRLQPLALSLVGRRRKSYAARGLCTFFAHCRAEAIAGYETETWSHYKPKGERAIRVVALCGDHLAPWAEAGNEAAVAILDEL